MKIFTGYNKEEWAHRVIKPNHNEERVFLFVNSRKCRRKVRKPSIALSIGFCIIVSSSAAAGNTTPYSISIEGFSPYFTPQRAFVTSGIPILWKNPTATHHTITHDGCENGGVCAFDSGAIRPHESFEISGLPPGQYSYHCTLHPIMRGVVEVGDQPGSSSTWLLNETRQNCLQRSWKENPFENQHPLTLKNGELSWKENLTQLDMMTFDVPCRWEKGCV